MAGRKDYDERRQRKREILEELAKKSHNKSRKLYEKYDKIASRIPLGQPILVDHYSAKRHINDINKIQKTIEKSIAEDKKAEYYEEKINTIDRNNIISSDDPLAIQKLELKLKSLEDCKAKVKAREHKTWELSNLNQQIRGVRERIKKLKELDDLQFETILFDNGKVIKNEEINRVQFVFNDVPDEKIRDILKSRGFKWSRYEKAWQRLYNMNSIKAAKGAIKDIKELNNN